MRRALVILIFLAACDSPGPEFMSAERSEVTVNEMRFALRRRSDRVVAIRRNFVARPDIAVIGRAAETAIEQYTGCTVLTMQGDVAQMIAEIDCTTPPDSGNWARWVTVRRVKAGNLFP